VGDPRIEAYARLLVERSIDPEPGWQVLVSTTTEARPLAQELSRQLAARGAYALPRISFGPSLPADLDWIEAAPPDLAPTLPPLERDVLAGVDASIVVLAPERGRKPATVEAARALRAHALAIRARGRRREIPEVRCDFPCAYFAEQAGLTLAEYEDEFYAACLRDWDSEREGLERVLARFDAASAVRIVSPDTDLTLSLEGRRGAIDDGHVNVPGGEVYFCPVEDSVEGVVTFDIPTRRDIEGIRLELRRGEVIRATADLGADLVLDALGTDEGARRFGELGIGCNEGITRPLRNVLFAEKMAGTVHLALGDSFPQLGGRNRSALHWDLVVDLRKGGELWCDGELVQRDGTWLF
jgi:aminopeptidase